MADHDHAAGEASRPPRARAACRRRGRSSARREAARCRRSSGPWPAGHGCAHRRIAGRPFSAGRCRGSRSSRRRLAPCSSRPPTTIAVDSPGDLVEDGRVSVEVVPRLVDVGEHDRARRSRARRRRACRRRRSSGTASSCRRRSGRSHRRCLRGAARKDSPSISNRSPKPFTRPSASTTRSPRRGPGGIVISSLSARRSAASGLGDEVVVGVDAGLALGLAGPRRHPDPLELALRALPGGRRRPSPRRRDEPASARARRSSSPARGCPRPRSSSRIQPATLSRK